MKVQKLIHHNQLRNLNITGAILLSIEEAEAYLTKNDRKYHNWWWLRSSGDAKNTAAFVNIVGLIDECGFYIHNDGNSIRPALIISNLTESGYQIGDVFEFGNKKFKIIADSLAFCLGDIGETYFDDVNNNYETSYIKEYINKWFNDIKRIQRLKNE